MFAGIGRADQRATAGRADERIIAQGCNGFQCHVSGALDGPFAKEHRQTALFLPYREPGNYGAFLVRALPLLMFVASVELPSFEIVSRGVV